MTFTGRRHRSHVWSLGRWRWPLALALWGGLFFIWVFPILVLLVVSVHETWYGRLDPAALTLDNYYLAVTDPNIQQAFTNSLLVAVGGATLGTVLVVGTAYYTERTDGRLRGVVDFLTLTPLAVPGIIIGAGLLFTFLWVGNVHPVVDLYGTLAIIIVGCVVVFLPVSSRIAVGNIVQIHSDLEEAARISGATWLGQMREIFLPLFKNTTVVIWFFLAMHVIQLLSIPLITYTSDTVVIPVRLYQLYMYEPGIALVAAISSIFILLTVGSLLGLRRVGVTFYELGER
jgi:iron(III) transport system permease protein